MSGFGKKSMIPLHTILLLIRCVIMIDLVAKGHIVVLPT